ncbi:hypothetical protein QL285_058547 [Trifolium repens]|jgi:hypothetical protein|nr:hypothetical protein QL285_080778 [Trifolium repens]KAK2396917.1 hypothetical protein QL285_058547 [Trifolium repens]
MTANTEHFTYQLPLKIQSKYQNPFGSTNSSPTNRKPYAATKVKKTTGPAEPPPTRSRETQDHRHDGSGEATILKAADLIRSGDEISKQNQDPPPPNHELSKPIIGKIETEGGAKVIRN